MEEWDEMRDNLDFFQTDKVAQNINQSKIFMKILQLED